MSIKLHHCRPLLLAAGCMLLIPPANAQSLPEDVPDDGVPKHYSIEVILFEYAEDVAGGNEIFEPEREDVFDDGQYGTADAATASDLEADDAGVVAEFGDNAPRVDDDEPPVEPLPLSGVGFRTLAAPELTMTDIHKKLTRLDAYQPVLWGGWVQRATEAALSPAVSLHALGALPPGMDGSLTLYLKNYLHLVADVTKTEQVAAIEPAYRFQRPAQANRRPGAGDGDDTYGPVGYADTILYRIHEDRIFRHGELRYFDHPRFGLLVRINRLDGSEAPQQSAER